MSLNTTKPTFIVGRNSRTYGPVNSDLTHAWGMNCSRQTVHVFVEEPSGRVTAKNVGQFTLSITHAGRLFSLAPGESFEIIESFTILAVDGHLRSGAERLGVTVDPLGWNEHLAGEV